VFTSDHGDQLGEHAKHNKGRPYETSAGVAFMVRWPKKVSSGRVIHTAYASIDFAPTILSAMGIKDHGVAFHGIDGSDELLAKSNVNNPSTDTQTRFMSDSQQGRWASAVRDGYKLVLSKGEPWLFDLNKDPHEVLNYYGQTNYTSIYDEMREDLHATIFQHGFPLADGEVAYWDKPACWDSRDQISEWKKRLCEDLADPRYSPGCQWRHIYEQCPVTCKRCCQDSKGKIMIHSALKRCKKVGDYCHIAKVRSFCPVTCQSCPGQNGSTTDNLFVDKEETEGNTHIDFSTDDDS